MLRLTLILTLAFESLGLGQPFVGQVFMVAENFTEDKCEVFAECDCCSSEIFFLSADKFCFVSKCISGDTYYKGTYTWNSSKLKLRFDKKYVEEITDEDYKVTKLETRVKNSDLVEFDIRRCGQKLRLTHATARDWKNGGQVEAKRQTELMKRLTSSKPWKQLSQ